MIKKLFNPLFIISFICFIAVMIILPHTNYPIPLQLGLDNNVTYIDGKSTLIISSIIPLIIELSFALFPDVDNGNFWSVFSDHAGKIIKNFVIILIITNNINALLKGFNINLVTINGSSLFLGVFFIIISNYLANISYLSNFGLRITPTINDQLVWIKTHRLVSYLLIFVGILLIIVSFSNLKYLTIFIPFFVIISFITIYLYSYRLIKKN